MKTTILPHKNLVKRIGTALLLFGLTALPAAAQTSVYNTMTLTGDFSGFDAGRNNMVLVSNNIWEITLSLTAADVNWFKFAANGSYGINWGHSSVTPFTVPFTSTATTNGTDIYIAPVQEGIYRFRFNNSTRQYWVDYMGRLPEFTNLMRNAGFETAGSSDFDAYHWERNVPDVFGDNWGNSFREDYRKHSGFWMGAVGADPVNFGGWYQDVTFLPDYEYVFKGYFYIDPAWTAAVQEVKVEFFDNAYNLVGLDSLTLTGLNNTWQLRSFTTTPPPEANWARTVINVSGAGTSGTLEFDDLEVIAVPRSSQTFDSWNFANAAGKHTRGGWLVSTGYVVVGDLARAIRSAALKNDTASPTNGGYVQSGMITSGVGTISFNYRHGWTNDETSPVGPIILDVKTSADGVTFGSVFTITNILNAGYQTFTKQFNFPAQKYIRIQHTGGSTNAVIIDDIQVEVPSSATLYQDFDNWPGTMATNGSHTFNGWLVRSGKVISAGAYAVQSALIAPSTNSFTNSITSVLYNSGIGGVTFNYARGTNGVGPASFAVQVSSNGTTWQTVDTVTQVLDPGYATYDQSFFFTTPHYLRIANLYSPGSGGGSGLVLIDEGFSTNTPTVGWNLDGGTTYYTTDPSSGVAIPSIKFDNNGDFIETPTIFGNPTGLTFWAKGQSLNGSTLLIEGSTNAGTTYNITIGLMTNISGTEDTYEYTLVNTNINKIKFTYTKVAGNLSFDDVKVTGSAGGANPPAQSLFVDNIYVGLPTEYRNQNFDTWPTQTGYGTHKFQGWTAGLRAIIDSQNAFQGKVLRLDNSGVQPYIQSPILSAGIGTISFKYRHWDGTPALTTHIQLSANGTNWITIATQVVSSTSYQTYEQYVNSTTNFAVRILLLSSSPTDRVLIDDIKIGKPLPAATLSIDASIFPTAPYTNDPVHILANYSPSFGAQNIAMTSYYRVGTSGVFTPIPMVITNFIQFGTVTPIPKQTTNTVVQYYIRASFTGPGSDVNSPVYYPAGGPTNPASYGIPRDPPGSVWINEVKYNDQFSEPFPGFEEFATVGFVELAGKAEILMDGWKLQFYLAESNTVLQASYDLTGQAIPDDIGGYGFWVIGTENVATRYMDLTNFLFETPLGIRLINEKGFVIDAISFGGTIANFEPVSANDFDDFPGTSGVSRLGFGFTRDEFSWQGGVTNTPGLPNVGQYFEILSTTLDPPPEMDWMVVSNGVMYLWSVANTSHWNAAPYYTTNLAANPPSWMPVTPFSSSPIAGSDNGENRVWFTLPTNINAAAYRIRFMPP